MAKLLKLRRGTTTQHNSFTGAEGEVTVDTTKDTLVVHDNSTAGGRAMLREDLDNMPASGVSAGTYGSSSAIPAITVDAKGRVTSATTSSIDSTSIANGTSNVSVANNGDITATHAGSTKLTVTSAGATVTGTLTATLNNSGVTAGSYGSSSAIPSITVDASGRVTAASTSSIDSTSIANGTSNVSVANNGDITLVRAGSTQATVDASGIKLDDSHRIAFGDSSDLKIYHDGSNSYIDDQGTGNLHIRAYGQINFDKYTGEALARFRADGSCELYHDNNSKLTTKSDGIDVTGEVQCDSLDVDGDSDITGQLSVNRVLVRDNGASSPIFNIRTDDDGPWAFALGNDTYSGNHEHGLRMYQATDGTLNIRNTGNSAWEAVNIQQQNGTANETAIQLNTDRAVDLRYRGSTKFTTKSDGVNINGELECDSLDVDGVGDFTGDVTFRGGYGAITLAADSDLRSVTGTWTGEAPSNTGKFQYHSNQWYCQAHSGWIWRNGSGNNILTLDTSGNLVANGNVTAYSDVTLKKDIETIPNALDKVMGMRGVNFTVKESDVRSTGVIAQEIEEQLPEVVMTDENGLKSVAYGNVVGVLIEAIKELKAEIEELKGGN